MSICVHYVYLCVCVYVCGVQAGDYVTCEWLVCMSICVHHVYLCVCVCVCVCEGGRGLVRVHLHGDNYSDT